MNDQRSVGAAFLLTQLGTHAARRFAGRIAVLDLTPPQAGLIRAVAREPGRSQQALAAHLGTPATRLVALVDALEQRGVLERRRNPDDRRLHAVHLTPAGEALLGDLGKLVAEHEAELLAALEPDERAALTGFLGRVAAAEDLTPGVHPGYRDLPVHASPRSLRAGDSSRSSERRCPPDGARTVAGSGHGSAAG